MLIRLWLYWNRETLHEHCIEIEKKIDIEHNSSEKRNKTSKCTKKKVQRNRSVKINSSLTEATDYLNVLNCKILLFNLFTVARPSVAKT